MAVPIKIPDVFNIIPGNGVAGQTVKKLAENRQLVASDRRFPDKHFIEAIMMQPTSYTGISTARLVYYSFIRGNEVLVCRCPHFYIRPITHLLVIRYYFNYTMVVAAIFQKKMLETFSVAHSVYLKYLGQKISMYWLGN